jgi:uncharacterized protein (DUF4415 family)
MKTVNSNLTLTQNAELAALAAISEGDINTSAVPEQRDWTGAKRGAFFRPVKKQLTLRLDADVIDWFKTHASDGQGYQTSINSALRAHVEQHGDK